MNKNVFILGIASLALFSCGNSGGFTAFAEPEAKKVSYDSFYEALSSDKHSQREYNGLQYVFPEVVKKASSFKKIVSQVKSFAIDKYTLGYSTNFDGVYHETGTVTKTYDFSSVNQETDEFKLQKNSDGNYQYTDKKTGIITFYDSSYFEKTFKPAMINKAAGECGAFRSGSEEGKFGLLHSLETIFTYYMQEGAKQDDYFDFHMNSQESFFKVVLKKKFSHNTKIVGTDNQTYIHRVVMDQFDYSFYCGIILKKKVVYYLNYNDVGIEMNNYYNIFDTVNTIYY